MNPINAIFSLPVSVLLAGAALAHVEPEPEETTRPTLTQIVVQVDDMSPEVDGVCRLPLLSVGIETPPQASSQPCIQEVRAE